MALFPGIVPGHYGLIKDQLVKQMRNSNPNLLDYECHIDSIVVDTLTLETLMERCNITQFDYLQIDTEGYDAKILLSSKLEKFMPKIINFEHSHLQMET
jgi:FkbM family methyltransferase